jgi:hypothetical protein
MLELDIGPLLAFMTASSSEGRDFLRPSHHALCGKYDTLADQPQSNWQQYSAGSAFRTFALPDLSPLLHVGGKLRDPASACWR